MAVTESHTYSTFYIDKFYFGILTTEVTELTKGSEVTPVPLAPPAIYGLINLRGQIATAIDMRQCLGITTSQYSEGTITLFFSRNASLFGLLVDSISDIVEVDEMNFEQPPTNLPEAAKKLIHGVYKLPDKLLFVLDPARLIDGIEVS